MNEAETGIASAGSTGEAAAPDIGDEVSIARVSRPGPSLLDREPGGVRRDRIVVLGRTQAGKTIYLAVLYHTLWRQAGSLSLVALDGPTHASCMEIIDTLKRGEWPSSTTGTRYLHLEARWRGESWPLVSLDYPGEVFRKAFLDNTQTEDVLELLDHIDRAAAVIVLVDPAIVSGKLAREAAEDDYGMLKALERIRSHPGGKDTPVAFVLTKYDARRALLDSYGGIERFVRKWYRQILKASRHLEVFVAAAVPQKAGDHTPQFDESTEPKGVVKPLNYLLERLLQSDQLRQAESEIVNRREALRQFQEEEERTRLRSTRFWVLFWIGFMLLATILAVGTLVIMGSE